MLVQDMLGQVSVSPFVNSPACFVILPFDWHTVMNGKTSNLPSRVALDGTWKLL